MKTAAKILSLAGGIICIMLILVDLIGIGFWLFDMAFSTVFTVGFSILTLTGAISPDSANIISSVIYGFTTSFFGTSNAWAVMFILFFILFAEFVGGIVTLMGWGLGFVLALVAAIINFVNFKKQQKSLYLAQTIIGGIIWYLVNAALGMILLAGGILGLIASKKPEPEVREVIKVKENNEYVREGYTYAN